MTACLGCRGGPENGYCLVGKGAGTVTLDKSAQCRWAGEGRDVEVRWGWQVTAWGCLVGRDRINLAALATQGLYQRLAAGKRMREQQTGAGSEDAEGVHQALLPLVGGQKIYAGAGLFESPRSFCAHCGHARASPPGRKTAAIHARGGEQNRGLAGEDDPVVATNLPERLVEWLPGRRRQYLDRRIGNDFGTYRR